jgi:hypothetical protein
MLKNSKLISLAIIAFLNLTTSAFAALPTNTYTLTSSALPPLTVNQTSAPVTFTVSNSTQQSTMLYLDWSASRLMWQPTSTTCSIVNGNNSATETQLILGANLSCAITGTFTPTQIGAQKLTTQLYMGAGKLLKAAPQQFIFQVVAPAPAPTPTPTPTPTPAPSYLTAAWTTPFNTSITLARPVNLMVTVKNATNSAAVLGTPTWSTSVSADRLQPAVSSTCGVTLAAQSTCTYVATFTANTIGDKIVNMTVNYNAGQTASVVPTSTQAQIPIVAVGRAGMILTSTDARSWQFQGGSNLLGLSFNATTNKFVAVGQVGVLLNSLDGATWNIAQVLPSATPLSDFFAVTSGAINVAVGKNGTVATSMDGEAWNLTKPVNVDLNAITFGNGYYVAVGKNSTIIYSTDATHWKTVSTLPTTENLYGIVYATGKFIAVGAKGTIISANDSDLTQWQLSVALPDATTLTAVTYGGGKFVAVGQQGVLLSSTDGNVWQRSSTQPTMQNLNAVQYVTQAEQAYFIAVGDSGTVLTGVLAADSISWTLKQAPIMNRDLYAVAVNNTLITVAGTGGLIAQSVDAGTQWQILTFSPLPDYLTTVVYSEQAAQPKFVATGEFQMISSVDGIHWQASGKKSLLYGFQSLLYQNGQFIGLVNKQLATSVDGISWNYYSLPQTRELYSLTYGNNQYVAVGLSVVFSCDDNNPLNKCAQGQGWVNVAQPLSTLYQVIYTHQDNLGFIAVGSQGTLASSADSTPWRLKNTSVNVALSSVAYGNGTAVAVGSSGTIEYASDPKLATWSSKIKVTGFDISQVNFRKVIFTHNSFVAIGDFGVFAYSTDGVNWTAARYAFNTYLSGLTG